MFLISLLVIKQHDTLIKHFTVFTVKQKPNNLAWSRGNVKGGEGGVCCSKRAVLWMQRKWQAGIKKEVVPLKGELIRRTKLTLEHSQLTWAAGFDVVLQSASIPTKPAALRGLHVETWSTKTVLRAIKNLRL